ncbi:hypothetical protein [Geobacter sp. AOG1]|uniref:hypothetical protein n=1 Tax=Geobacter sp. AOG1 TaxID=1566346 RepID=UPI001CC7893D|nr:hypothetical protein [Geobacter sp. AOG1]GFE56403.1 hypothetical protein AOG1_02820 [Geobacter sp. AOG1]
MTTITVINNTEKAGKCSKGSCEGFLLDWLHEAHKASQIGNVRRAALILNNLLEHMGRNLAA